VDTSPNLNDDIEEVLIAEDALQARIAELGATISHDYQGKDLLLLGILKGAIMFMVDLSRQLTMPVELEFMATSSYGNARESSGEVRILKDLDVPIEGKHLLIVEDIIDTGLTLRYLMESLQQRRPASIRVCALLDKAKARDKVLAADYLGFEIPDRFVVGYGLDYAQKYRNLPYIGVLKPSIYHDASGASR
jgi:hypoxanthine phosphoribosyltransferase